MPELDRWNPPGRVWQRLRGVATAGELCPVSPAELISHGVGGALGDPRRTVERGGATFPDQRTFPPSARHSAMTRATDGRWTRLPRALGRTVAVVREAAPGELRLPLLLQAVGAVCLVGQLVLARYILQQVLGPARSDHTRLIAAVVTLGALTAVSAFCSGLATERRRLLAELVSRHATRTDPCRHRRS